MRPPDGPQAVTVAQAGCPYEFRGKRAVGTVWFLLDLVLFLVELSHASYLSESALTLDLLLQINLVGIIPRAAYHPKAFRRAVYSHEDGLYLPCISLAFASICKSRPPGPPGLQALRAITLFVPVQTSELSTTAFLTAASG